jgi:hypothetical protein
VHVHVRRIRIHHDQSEEIESGFECLGQAAINSTRPRIRLYSYVGTSMLGCGVALEQSMAPNVPQRKNLELQDRAEQHVRNVYSPVKGYTPQSVIDVLHTSVTDGVCEASAALSHQILRWSLCKSTQLRPLYAN